MKVDRGLVGMTKGSPGSCKEGRGEWVCVNQIQILHKHVWSCQIVNASVNVAEDLAQVVDLLLCKHELLRVTWVPNSTHKNEQSNGSSGSKPQELNYKNSLLIN